MVARDVEKAILARPETKTVYSRIGGGSSPYSGSMSVQLKDGVNTDTVIASLRSSLSQYRRYLVFSKPNQFLGVGGGMGGASVRGRPVQISVQGPVSVDVLDGSTQQIMSQLSTIPGIRDVGESLPPQMPEMEINVDRLRAADAGISASTISNTISTLVGGSTATQIDWQGLLTDVNVSLRDADITNQSALQDLSIPGANGTLYPLSSLATVTAGTGPTQLSRQNQQSIIPSALIWTAGLPAR